MRLLTKWPLLAFPCRVPPKGLILQLMTLLPIRPFQRISRTPPPTSLSLFYMVWKNVLRAPRITLVWTVISARSALFYKELTPILSLHLVCRTVDAWESLMHHGIVIIQCWSPSTPLLKLIMFSTIVDNLPLRYTLRSLTFLLLSKKFNHFFSKRGVNSLNLAPTPPQSKFASHLFMSMAIFMGLLSAPLFSVPLLQWA